MRRIRIEVEIDVAEREPYWTYDSIEAWVEEALEEEGGEKIVELVVKDLGEVEDEGD